MSPGRSAPVSVIQAAGHLAVWVGLYFAAAYVLASLVLGGEIAPAALAASFCAGVGLYLLDRVKVCDAWLDPADLAGGHARHAFLRRHRRAIRITAWAILAAGYLSVSAPHPSNLALPAIGIGGVVWYSKPAGRGPRLKDRAMLKNLLPALAIASLAVALAETSLWHLARQADRATVLVFVGLVLQVAADAMLCDLDDAEVDRDHGTRTLASELGRDRTFSIAALVQIVAGVLWVCAGTGQLQVFAGGVTAIVALGTNLVLWVRPSLRVRDLVDLKLSLAVGLVWLTLVLLTRGYV